MATPPPSLTIHASCVSLDGRAVLITGASGRGKSALALQLTALGAMLVADDRTILGAEKGRLIATCPETISGLIEARGVGILRLPPAGPSEVVLVVDLDRTELARLPEPQDAQYLGITLPCLHGVASPHFPAAVLHCLRHGICRVP